MQLATKATGAFPAGLLYREFTADNFNKAYLENVMKRIALGQLGTEDPDPEKRIKLKYLKKGYSSFTVDGGAINNEPYREVMSLLKDKYAPITDERYPQFGVVMIDPFPDQGQFSGPYEKPADLLDVVPAILGALTDQARVKRRELLENDSADSFRAIIFPRRWTIHHPEGGEPFPSPEKHPIASAGAMAFAGLLDIEFRQHDFFLGRNNARNFFRYWFSFPYDEANDIIHPIHRSWTQAMRQAFAFKPNERSDDLFLPIIPDIQLLLAPQPTEKWEHLKLTIDQFPQYDADRLFRLRPAMTSRFLQIIELLKTREGKRRTKPPGRGVDRSIC